ncbi:hypothetical protein OEA41_001454 [Lepraria neglecta]|uniref:Uncharacterized protein n=1 Tax=Lepraria neglecta TaxID=209136 RepID=A0AAE0DLX6_9LECA|nr:hypothetical protein OEA41_001454 [Lepraria neglecta]
MDLCDSPPVLTGTEPIASCTALVLHPTQSTKSGNSPNFTFKARARDQILLQGNELETERKRHKYEINALQDQYHEDVHRLRTRAEGFERHWKTLDARLTGLKSEVEGIQPDPNPQASIVTSDASTQTQHRTESQAQLLAEVNQWRTAFGHLPGSLKQKAVVSREIGRKQGELKRQVTDLQKQVDSSSAYATQLQQDIKAHGTEHARLSTELQQAQDLNAHLSALLGRELSAREMLVGAFAEYQKAITPGNSSEVLGIEMGPRPSIRNSDPRKGCISAASSQQNNASPVAQTTKTTRPDLSNKRKRDNSEVDIQSNDAFQPRKRIDFSDYKMLRPEGPWRSTDASQPDVQVSRDLSTNWRALAVRDPSTGQHLRTRTAEATKASVRFFAVQNSAPVSIPPRSALAASQAVKATSRNIGDAETVSPIRTPGSPIMVRTPGIVFPVEKKWKHSMLRRAWAPAVGGFEGLGAAQW